jgi:hypothetical protein
LEEIVIDEALIYVLEYYCMQGDTNAADKMASLINSSVLDKKLPMILCSILCSNLIGAKWLVQKFDINVSNPYDRSTLLNFSVMSNQIPIVQWTIERFGLTITDANFSGIMRFNAKWNQPPTDAEKWIVNHFNLTETDCTWKYVGRATDPGIIDKAHTERSFMF